MSVGALPIHARDRARHRRERERMHAEVQAGLWAGASPVRRLSPEEIAAYEAELRERDKPRGPAWTTPMPGTRTAPAAPPEPKSEPQEEPMEHLERARSLRAELEQIEQQREAKRREALTLADALEQEARVLRELVGAVPVELVHTSPPPPAKPAPRQRPLDKQRGYGSQRARIIAAMPLGEDVRATQIAKALGRPLATIGAELRALARRGEIQQTGRGLFRRAS